MADLERMNGNTGAVADYISQAIEQSANEPEKDKYSILLAEHYIHTGQYNDAREIAESVYERYPERSDLKNKAEEILGYLHTVVSDEQ